MTAAAILLAVGTAVVFYIIAGYPIILALLSRRPPRRVAKCLDYQPSVSVLLAVYNGEQFIRAKLESLLRQKYPREKVEILVVSDGSTDGTESIVESFAGRGVRLLRVPRGGKAEALNTALPNVSGEILLFTDVRQTLDPMAMAHLAANFADPGVGVATGLDRMMNPDKVGEQADIEIYWRYEFWARHCHSRIDSTLVTTGSLYALRRSLAEPIQRDTISDDAYIPLRVLFRGYRVIYDPAAVAFDYPTAEGAEFRRRMRTLMGLWQLHVRLPQLFTRANRMRFHFFSHKSARLVLPWAILLVWAATMALPASPFRSFLLIDETALVALAAADRFVPRGFILKRLSSPARTFLTMNVAALLALRVFFGRADAGWRPTQVKVRQ
ncbi:MAG: glycosyltransferase family 2 protein [Acidobacteriia bacterium]|nr:glycosyltransferase family 2 protein [Terriglobia bacterium]